MVSRLQEVTEQLLDALGTTDKEPVKSPFETPGECYASLHVIERARALALKVLTPRFNTTSYEVTHKTLPDRVVVENRNPKKVDMRDLKPHISRAIEELALGWEKVGDVYRRDGDDAMSRALYHLGTASGIHVENKGGTADMADISTAPEKRFIEVSPENMESLLALAGLTVNNLKAPIAVSPKAMGHTQR